MRPLLTEDTVFLADIRETNDAFRITTEVDKDSEQLVASLAEVGLMTPLILKKDASGGHIIVTGFRRLAALKTLGVDAALCRLLSPDTSALDCLKLAITDNVFQRPLNPGEQARALSLLAPFFDDPDHLREMAASLLLPSSRAEIDKLQKAAGLPSRLFDYFTCEQIPLSIAVILAGLDESAALMLADIFTGLKLGVNKQRESLTLIEEIAVREDKTLMQVFEDDSLRQIVDDDQADRGRRAADLRSWLRQRRFPAITQKQAWFSKQNKALKLGNRMSLSPPANFEGVDYILQMTFRDLEELETHARRLAEIAGNPTMKELLS
mgnify:CR=1 FL=1